MSTFKIGDKCRAVYSVDGQEYDVEVTKIYQDEDAKEIATVLFTGYGNVEEIPVKDLKPPLKTNITKAWKEGDDCMALYSGDNQMYKARIKSLNEDSNGDRFAEVLFVEYDETEPVWLEYLAPLEDSPHPEEVKEPSAASSEAISDFQDVLEVTYKQTTWKCGMSVVAYHTKMDKEIEDCSIAQLLKNADGDAYAVLSCPGLDDFTAWMEDLKIGHAPRKEGLSGDAQTNTEERFKSKLNGKDDNEAPKPATKLDDFRCAPSSTDLKCSEPASRKIDESVATVGSLAPLSNTIKKNEEPRMTRKTLKQQDKEEVQRLHVSSKEQLRRPMTTRDPSPFIVTSFEPVRDPSPIIVTSLEPVEQKACNFEYDKFVLGDFCRAQVNDGSDFVEGMILEFKVDDASGTKFAKFKALGYNDDYVLPVRQLKPSHGSAARDKQIKSVSGTSTKNSNQSNVTLPKSGEKGASTLSEISDRDASLGGSFDGQNFKLFMEKWMKAEEQVENYRKENFELIKKVRELMPVEAENFKLKAELQQLKDQRQSSLDAMKKMHQKLSQDFDKVLEDNKTLIEKVEMLRLENKILKNDKFQLLLKTGGQVDE